MSFLDKLCGIAKNIGGQDGGMLAVNKLNSKIHAAQTSARRKGSVRTGRRKYQKLILLVKERMKMLRKKSLLALLLSLCMVVGILPATVFAAGQYVPENPRWSGYGNQVMWDKPANASGSTYLEYEAQLVLNGQVLQTESVEIDRWVFFDSKNITQSKDAYTLKVRARQIYLTGDPDGSYTVWKRDAWGDWAIGGNTGGGEGPTPTHEHSFGGWKNNGTQHWKECSCGEISEESPHNFGEWELIYYDVNTKYDVCERRCLTCGYEQIDRYREHQHYYTDDWSSGSTTHWKVCYYCKEVNQDTVADHTFGDWTITKEPTTTETGSRERTCSICKYTQKETLPVHTHDVHDEAWKYDDTEHWQECSCGEMLNVAKHSYGDWRETKPATETEKGSRERGCTVCDYVQTETIPMLEHEHGIHDETWKYDDTNHWQECSCGEKLNVANHAYGEWRVTKPATETEEGSKARDCTVCDHVQTETIPMLEHEHGIHDETWKYDKTQHWQECSCGEKLNVANHTYGDWKVTKEATETEEGSRERGCAVCEYVQTEAIPAAGTGEPTDSTEPTDPAKPEQPGKPSEQTESPQTGNNSNMFLWVALLFASGGVLTVLGVTDKRKKKGITK